MPGSRGSSKGTSTAPQPKTRAPTSNWRGTVVTPKTGTERGAAAIFLIAALVAVFSMVAFGVRYRDEVLVGVAGLAVTGVVYKIANVSSARRIFLLLIVLLGLAATGFAEYNVFKPHPDNRTFGGQVGHTANAQFAACAAAKGVPNPNMGNDLEKKTTKAEFVKGLADSFAFCDDAFAALTDQSALELVTQGRRHPLGGCANLRPIHAALLANIDPGHLIEGRAEFLKEEARVRKIYEELVLKQTPQEVVQIGSITDIKKATPSVAPVTISNANGNGNGAEKPRVAEQVAGD